MLICVFMYAVVCSYSTYLTEPITLKIPTPNGLVMQVSAVALNLPVVDSAPADILWAAEADKPPASWGKAFLFSKKQETLGKGS